MNNCDGQWRAGAHLASCPRSTNMAKGQTSSQLRESSDPYRAAGSVSPPLSAAAPSTRLSFDSGYFERRKRLADITPEDFVRILSIRNAVLENVDRLTDV